MKRFKKTGNVNKQIRQKRRYSEDDSAASLAMDSLRENPKLSLRKRASRTDISKSLICKILKENKITAFKPRYRHNFEYGDEDNRL